MLILTSLALFGGVVHAATLTQRFDPARLTYNAANAPGFFLQNCGSNKFLVASTINAGVTISFAFKGTSITLNALTDVDRGSYQVTVDNQPSTMVSGVTSTQACTPVFSQNGLRFIDHIITVVANNNTLPGGAVSAKLEFLSFDYTVPDNATSAPNQTAQPSSQPSSQIDNSALPTAAIPGIAVSVIMFFIAVILALLLAKARRRSQSPESYHPPKTVPIPAPFTHPIPYSGRAELMTEDRPLQYSHHMPLSDPSLYYHPQQHSVHSLHLQSNPSFQHSSPPLPQYPDIPQYTNQSLHG